MRVLALADAHIASPATPQGQAFLRFLHREQGRTDLLVIAGDLFEFLVGRQKRALKVYEPILEALDVFSSSSQVVVLEGNHDFCLNGSLPSRCIIGEEFLLSTLQGKILFTHGDDFTMSSSYFRIRSFLRSRAALYLMETLPSGWVWNGAMLWARLSRFWEEEVDDRRLEHLKVVAYKKIAGRAKVLITGHFHRPFAIPLREGAWIGLGSWQKERFYLELNDSTGFQCHRFLDF